MTLFACATVCSFGLLDEVEARQVESLEEIEEGAGVEEQLGSYLPLDTQFVNELGEVVQLESFFDGKTPIILNFVYHDCPMLCSVVLQSLTKSLKQLDWSPNDQFDVLTVSFSAAETPALASRSKAKYAAELENPDAIAGWHFLTGSEENIHALAEAAGYGFKWNERAAQYVHSAVLIFVSGKGKVTRYLYGIEYPERAVKNALVEASAGTVGTTLDRLILYCFQYDPSKSAYVLHATRLMKLGAAITLLALVTLFAGLRRRERKQRVVRQAKLANS